METTAEINSVLAAVDIQRERQKASWRNDGARFNVFDALKIQFKEMSHSTFLAFLLDPSQSHDQGDRYLRSFLELIDVVVPETLDNIQVVVERPIPPYGQLDILIFIPSVLTICIENKIGARDQENQMSRYIEWLNADANSKGTRAAVYLSPSGRPPQRLPVGINTNILKLLSYGQIADWLQQYQSPKRLSAVTNMYVQACRAISGVAMKNPLADQIGQILNTPEQFAIALDIAEFVAKEKPRIINRFWQNACNSLDKKLSESGFSNRWEMQLSMKQGWLAMVTVEAGVDISTGYRLCYAVTAEGLNTSASYFGIRRGYLKQVGAEKRLDAEIAHELAASDFRENEWWCGYRRSSIGGLLPSVPDENGHISLLNKDNQATESPLAAQVADVLWSLFVQLRERLEHINDSRISI
jgi:hypothetical protein